MSRKEEKRSGMSQSFATGVVAAVFLIVGYQTAVFIHRAAVVKIAADRDDPDTVYLYMPQPDVSAQARPDQEGDRQQVEISSVKTVRRNSTHSPRVETIRHNMPYRKIETFSFNPNTVSIDDLCRLGFSIKQAQSIDNYRQKGGHFRRKSDFADSYVVSDSIYRRLESFIDIPLIDLNSADSAEFDALPGIGGWFASKMIEHREALGGYSCKEQLMDIYRFDLEKYNALSDLIVVSEPYDYPLWELSADSLRSHPYIRNYETARAIVLFRNNNPPSLWTLNALAESGVISSEVAHNLSRCVIQKED